jgi:hypothetical protein
MGAQQFGLTFPRVTPAAVHVTRRKNWVVFESTKIYKSLSKVLAQFFKHKLTWASRQVCRPGLLFSVTGSAGNQTKLKSTSVYVKRIGLFSRVISLMFCSFFFSFEDCPRSLYNWSCITRGIVRPLFRPLTKCVVPKLFLD